MWDLLSIIFYRVVASTLNTLRPCGQLLVADVSLQSDRPVNSMRKWTSLRKSQWHSSVTLRTGALGGSITYHFVFFSVSFNGHVCFEMACC